MRQFQPLGKEKKILWFCIVFFLTVSVIGKKTAEAALLLNIPVTVYQPNGERLDLLASGDEFYNWLHDQDGYTIIRDPDTGYYVYAKKQNGNLLSSAFPVSSVRSLNMMNIQSLGIQKYLLHSPEFRKNPKQQYPEGSPANPELILPAPKTGTINNIVVFIRFSDEPEFTDTISYYDGMLNSSVAGANSMYNYYREASYNQLAISTTFYPTPATTVVSYQDSFVRNYYKPYDASTNPIGYQTDTQRRDREHILLKNAVDAISSLVPPGLNVDGDGDGRVDNVCFIIYGSSGGWSDLLWPHMWSLYSQYAYINSKRVYTYNFQLQNSLKSSGVGVLCHEMFHSLSAPDLYHYSFDGFHPTGNWGLMEYTSNPPRHMLAFMKYRYGTWISSLPEITLAGTYLLNPLTSSTNSCYRIVSPYHPNEYFVVEYRRKNSTFENSLPGEGLIVSRINSLMDGWGNSNGPPDEVYLYRPGGTPTSDGTYSQANFNSSVGRTSINDGANPSSFLSDGTYGGLSISNIGAVGSTISFDVGFPAVGSSLLRVGASATGTTMSVSPNDSYGKGGGNTDFTRAFLDGTVVSLSAPATAGSLSFQKWYQDGVVYSTNTSIGVTMNSDHRLFALYGIDLAEALDNTNLTWQVDSKGWYGQTTTHYNGNDAAQSADISDNEQAVLRTVVFGPANISFYWKVSSEANYDYLRFLVDSTPVYSISGEVGWQQKTYSIGAGTHTLEWKYSKDQIVSSGSDAGWVDLILFTSSRALQALNSANPESLISANTNGDGDDEIAADFGPLGLWLWNDGSWFLLTSSNCENVIAADTNADGDDEIVADFGPLGLWLWNDGAWYWLTSLNCENVIAADTNGDGDDDLAVDFGSLGLWLWYDGGWIWLTSSDCESMIAADTNADGDEDLVVDFGSAGLYLWTSGTWTLLTSSNAETLIRADTDMNGADEIFADFGALGLFHWKAGSWTLLNEADPDQIFAADVDGNGDDELIVDFGAAGLHLWNGGSWSMLTMSNPDLSISAQTDADASFEIMASFAGVGLFEWNGGGWTSLTTSLPQRMISGDTNADGIEEVVIDFGLAGLWIW